MLQLQVRKRDIFGKKLGELRSTGSVPAEIYGHGKENTHVSVVEKDFERILREAGESTIIEILLGTEKHPVLIYDIQRDPLKNTVLHVDFYEVRMDENVTTEVPLLFTGEAPAVKTSGGVLVKSLEEIEVEALPMYLPQHIEVSLLGLTELNQTIYIKDLQIPDNVKILTDPDTAVVSVTEQQVEEEAPAPEAAPAEGEAAPAEGEAAPTEEKKG